MPHDQAAVKIANDSGFPLQIAVEQIVSEGTKDHGWKVLHSEHSWANTRDGGSGFIDVVLQDSYGCTHLVVECKRSKDKPLVFFNRSGHAMGVARAKAFTSHYRAGKTYRFDWMDIEVAPGTPEAEFCTTSGDSASGKNVFVDRIGSTLVSSTEALAAEQENFHASLDEFVRFYLNVLVTNAPLTFLKFDPASVSLKDGSIPEGKHDAKQVPFVRLRKQLATHPLKLGPKDFRRGVDPGKAKEHTVFVVHAPALPDFLAGLAVYRDSIRGLQAT